MNKDISLVGTYILKDLSGLGMS